MHYRDPRKFTDATSQGRPLPYHWVRRRHHLNLELDLDLNLDLNLNLNLNLP